MSWIDVAILVIIAISAVTGLARGFVKESISLISWVAAIWVATTYAAMLGAQLPQALESPNISLGPKAVTIGNVRVAVGFVILFIATLLVGAVVKHLLAKVTQTPVLRGTDRALGAIFGLLRGAVVVVALVMAAGLTSIPRTDTWRQSLLVGPFEQGAKRAIELLPPQYARYFTFDNGQQV